MSSSRKMIPAVIEPQRVNPPVHTKYCTRSSYPASATTKSRPRRRSRSRIRWMSRCGAGEGSAPRRQDTRVARSSIHAGHARRPRSLGAYHTPAHPSPMSRTRLLLRHRRPPRTSDVGTRTCPTTTQAVLPVHALRQRARRRIPPTASTSAASSSPLHDTRARRAQPPFRGPRTPRIVCLPARHERLIAHPTLDGHYERLDSPSPLPLPPSAARRSWTGRGTQLRSPSRRGHSLDPRPAASTPSSPAPSTPCTAHEHPVAHPTLDDHHERLDSPSPSPSRRAARRRPADAAAKRRGRENKTAGNHTPRATHTSLALPAWHAPRAARTPPRTHMHPAREMEWRVRPS
ncbi:hypothetical protein B0H13DRAFT_2673037 [Mycena leptocephala]|nr:hypothetical protein B0H13DRAFT_2673037 [Mycena leptocephala]